MGQPPRRVIGDRVETPHGPGVVEALNDEPGGYMWRKYGEGVWVRMDEAVVLF